MNKTIINEIYRIQEIMGVDSKKIISESIGGLLDDAIALLKAGSKLPPDVERELVDLLVANGKNEDDLAVFLEKYNKASKEQDKITLVRVYFGKTKSQVNDAVTVALRSLSPAEQGAIYSQMLLGSQSKDAWRNIEYLRDKVAGGAKIDDLMARQINQQLKYWDQVKSELKAANPGNRDINNQIFAIDQHYRELRDELEIYNINSKTTTKGVDGNPIYKTLYSDDPVEETAKTIWNQFAKSNNPDEIKVFNELKTKYTDEQSWIDYVKSQFDDTAKINEATEKVKNDILLKLNNKEKNIFEKYIDKFCVTSSKIASDRAVSSASVKGLGVSKETYTVKGGDTVDKLNFICNTIKKISQLTIWMAILPSLGGLIAGLVVYWKNRIEKTVENVTYSLGKCLDENEMNKWKGDSKNNPFNEVGNWTEYDSTICGNKQIKYKKLEQVGSGGNWEWDGQTYLRLTTDENGEFTGVAILTDEIKAAVEDTKSEIDSTLQNIENKADSVKADVQQKLNIPQESNPEPAPKPAQQNKLSFRDRRRKQQ